MIEKQTVVDQIEITRDGTIQVRFGLLLVENGVEVGHQWHRTSIEPGGDVKAQIAAVNLHLSQPQLAPGITGNWPPANLAAIDRVRTLATAAWTPEVIAAYKARLIAGGVAQ